MKESWHVRKPNPGLSDHLRFQSTAQTAMAGTALSYAELPPASERVKALRERKVCDRCFAGAPCEVIYFSLPSFHAAKIARFCADE